MSKITLVEGLNELNIKLTPLLALDFADLSILNVQGVPFASIGTTKMLNWDAFGAMLDKTLGTKIPNYTVPEGEIIIGDGVAFADYVAQKFVPSALLLAGRPQMEDREQLGIAVLKVGLEHPELLGQGALSFPAPQERKWGQDGAFTTWMAKFGVMPYPGFTWEEKALYITSPTQASPEMVTIAVNTVNYIGVQPEFGPYVDYTMTFKVNNWVFQKGYTVSGTTLQLLLGALAPFTGPTATLAQPIEMSRLDGIMLTIMGKKTLAPYIARGNLVAQVNMWYEAAFDAPMPPPVYRGGGTLEVGQVTESHVKGTVAPGYYYPGIYDARIAIWWEAYPYSGVINNFRIKNLAKVTGEGTT